MNSDWIYDEDEDAEENDEERQEQLRKDFRVSQLSAAVKTFFPEVFEFGVVRAIIYGYKEVDLNNPPPFFAPI